MAAYTQDFFTSRRNFDNSTTYVGQLDRLWYDPVTNTIRIGDGSPGGKKVCDATGAGSPLTTKGDIFTFGSADAALPVGTDDYVLTADSLTATGLAWKPITGGIAGMQVTIINGQPTLTLEDTTRANKILSVSENPIRFTDNKLKNNEWLQIGKTNHADSAYIAEFNGTVTFSSGHCQKVNNNNKFIHIFINDTDMGQIGLFTGATADNFINTTINIDFVQGDRIRLRARDGTAGRIEDTVVKIILKWRG